MGGRRDLAVRPGTAVAEISSFARSLGIELGPIVWCGTTALDARHPSGAWPLVEGAHLDSRPGLPCAPERGPTLIVVAGPAAGARCFVDSGSIVVGRGHGADLAIDDPGVSRRHVAVRANPTLSADDLGSTNGTVRWRGGSRRALGRHTGLEPGDIMVVGSSLVAVLEPGSGSGDPAASPPSRSPRPADSVGRFAPLAASLVSGLMLAAMTGSTTQGGNRKIAKAETVNVTV